MSIIFMSSRHVSDSVCVQAIRIALSRRVKLIYLVSDAEDTPKKCIVNWDLKRYVIHTPYLENYKKKGSHYFLG